MPLRTFARSEVLPEGGGYEVCSKRIHRLFFLVFGKSNFASNLLFELISNLIKKQRSLPNNYEIPQSQFTGGLYS
jgi:hypothetical protein